MVRVGVNYAKKILLVSILILILSGCMKIDKNSQNYISIINNCLNTKTISNDVALGYKYYLPKGVKLIQNYDYNQKFSVGQNDLYMYVDINSYYYKSKLKKQTSDNYYYHKIKKGKKTGYISISKSNNLYFTKIVYNYAKMEFYSNSNDLNNLITLSTIILNSIDYNDIIIEKVLGENLGDYSEITYELKKPEDASNDFSQYLEEYVQEDKSEKKLPDE